MRFKPEANKSFKHNNDNNLDKSFDKSRYKAHKIQGANNIKVFLEDVYQIDRKDYGNDVEKMVGIDPLLRMVDGVLYQRLDKWLS